MKIYQCKSKIINGQPCAYNCVVKSHFEPKACLHSATHEEWEDISGLPYKNCYITIETNFDEEEDKIKFGYEIWDSDREEIMDYNGSDLYYYSTDEAINEAKSKIDNPEWQKRFL